VTAFNTAKSSSRVTILLWIPAAVYLLSYVYLAFYHQKVWLWNVIVHEGGTLTLLQTVLYASHFLGHVPSLTVIALLFAGAGMLFTRVPQQFTSAPNVLIVLLAVFLISSGAVAAALFGWEDALAYVSQTKQSMVTYTEGGSWNLHLPSTIVLFALIPPYMFFIVRVMKIPTGTPRGAKLLIAAAAVSCVLFTFLFNRGSLNAFSIAFSDPRYLAHSIRELATFPLTIFPLPLFFLMRGISREPNPEASNKRRTPTAIIFLLIIGIAAVIYQCYVPLSVGIGQLAQKPAFAGQGTLSVPYLLASHYFEHVLDSVYFTLLTLLVWSVAARRPLQAK
jgi:hypothetical protein